MGSNIGTCITSWILSLSSISNNYLSFLSIDNLLGIIAIFLSILCYLFVLGIKKINKKRIEQKNNRQIDIH